MTDVPGRWRVTVRGFGTGPTSADLQEYGVTVDGAADHVEAFERAWLAGRAAVAGQMAGCGVHSGTLQAGCPACLAAQRAAREAPQQEAQPPAERYPGSAYADDITSLISAFEYETCPECSEDLDRHAIGPDIMGHAHAYCLTEALSNALDASADI